MKTRLIVNPAAGGGRARARAPAILRQLEEALGPVEVRYTAGPRDALSLAGRAVKEGVERLLVLGGDGTGFEVINGAFEETDGAALPFSFGFIPVGTGNSFLRDLSIFDAKEAIGRISRGKTRPVDLLRFSANGVSRAYAHNLLGVGFIADVCDFTNRYLKWMGPAGYAVGTFARLVTLQNPPLSLTLDGRTFHFSATLVGICNSRFTGGAMEIAPAAEIDDGLADIIVVKDVSRLSLARTFPKLFQGTHIHHPAVEVHRAKSITIVSEARRVIMPDGEILGTTPLSCEVLPKAISLYA